MDTRWCSFVNFNVETQKPPDLEPPQINWSTAMWQSTGVRVDAIARAILYSSIGSLVTITVSKVAQAARCKGCGVKGSIVSTRIVFAVPE
jgi:hypothetical protein